MFFYVVFACFLGFSRDRAVLAFVAFICGIVTLASMLPPENDALRFWSQPIILEFALGSLIALAYLRGVTLSRITRLMLITLALVLWLTVPVSWFTDTSGPGFYSWTRLLIWGTGAVLIVAAAALGSTFIHSSLSRMIVALGDSSYTLYLLHPFLFLLVKAVLTKLTVPEFLLWPLVLAIAFFSIASAALIYRLAESPILAYLRAYLPKRVGITPSSYYSRSGKLQ
jgi:peptidoglycan/LPS O-acetylase OafA/YrhL